MACRGDIAVTCLQMQEDRPTHPAYHTAAPGRWRLFALWVFASLNISTAQNPSCDCGNHMIHSAAVPGNSVMNFTTQNMLDIAGRDRRGLFIKEYYTDRGRVVQSTHSTVFGHGKAKHLMGGLGQVSAQPISHVCCVGKTNK